MSAARPLDGVVRPARADDVPVLVALDVLCWPPPLRSPAGRIERRLAHAPDDQFVMTIGGDVVGAIYTQRIAQAASLDGLTAERFDSLHDPAGNVAQLI